MESRDEEPERVLDVEGYPYGRDNSFVLECAVRFHITAVHENGLFGTNPTRVSIQGVGALPTICSWIKMRVKLTNRRDPRSHAVDKLFSVHTILWTETRPITIASLFDYLVPLYDATHGKLYSTGDLLALNSKDKKKKDDQDDEEEEDDEEAIIEMAITGGKRKRKQGDKYKKSKRSKGLMADAEDLATRQPDDGKKWFIKCVLPILQECNWPKRAEDAPTIDNFSALMDQFAESCENYAQKQSIVNLTGDRYQASLYRDIYSIIYSKIRPCCRGSVFEVLLCYFHETFLFRLSAVQQLALYMLMLERPEIMIDWRMVADELSKLRDANGKPLFPASMNLYEMAGHNAHLPSDTYLDQRILHFDARRPRWNWAMYMRFKEYLKRLCVDPSMQVDKDTRKIAENTLVRLPKDEVLYDALKAMLVLDRYLYFNCASGIPTPESPNFRQYFKELFFNFRPESLALLQSAQGPLKNPHRTWIQPNRFFKEENEFAELLMKVKRIVFIDADFMGPLLMKHIQNEIIDVLLKDDEADPDEVVHVYSCNQECALYETQCLGTVNVHDIYGDLVGTSYKKSRVHLIVTQAHKIPLARLILLLKRYSKKGLRSIHFVGNQKHSVNYNLLDNTYISFYDAGRILSSNSKKSALSYIRWEASRVVFVYGPQDKNEFFPSVKSYIYMVQDNEARMFNIKIKNKKEIVDAYKKQAKKPKDADRKAAAVDSGGGGPSHLFLCSTEKAKSEIMKLIFEEKQKKHPQNLMLREYVYIHSHNTRGKIIAARRVDDDRSETDVSATEKMDPRHSDYVLEVNGRHYNTCDESIDPSSVETINRYCGPPVRFVKFIATKETELRDLFRAASFATEKFEVYYTMETDYSQVFQKSRDFPYSSDLMNKLYRLENESSE